MFKVLKNEIIKMFSQKKFYVMAAILIGSIIIMALTKDSKINAKNFVFETFTGTIIKPILPAFMIILIAEIITEDYVHGTMKFSLMTPIKRSELIIGKLLFIDLCAFIFLTLSFIVSYIVCAITFSSGIRIDFIKYFIFNIKAYASIILPLFSFCTLISLIGMCVNNSGVTIGIGLGLQFMTIIIEHSIKNGVYFLSGGGMYIYDYVRSSGQLNNISIPMVSVCACIYILIFLLLNIFVIERKDMVL